MTELFYGHKFVKIADNWVLDISEGIGYFIETDESGNIKNYTKKYRITPNQTRVDKVSDVPDSVVDKQIDILNKFIALQ